MQDLLTGTSRNFPASSALHGAGVCGAGMLDVGAAVGEHDAGRTARRRDAFPVVEYYRADLDHYFITAIPAEMQVVDAFLRGIFKRTGL